MSLGYNLQSRPVRAALQDAYDHNVVVVASAGNSGDTAGADGTGQAPYSFPADYPGVLAVAAVNSNDQVSSFSSENLSVQVAAPGDRVPAQGRNGHYWYVSGTSPGVRADGRCRRPHQGQVPVADGHPGDIRHHEQHRAAHAPGGRLGRADRIRRRRRRRGTDRRGTASRRRRRRRRPGRGGAISAAGRPRSRLSRSRPAGQPDSRCTACSGSACLGLVALSTSRLLAARELPADGPDESQGGGPARSGTTRVLPSSAATAPPARHAAPRGRGHNPAGPS